MRKLAMTTALCISLGQNVSAQSGIRNEPVLDDGLFTVGLAHQIRRYCPQISARMFRAIGVLRGLERAARDLGYDEDDVRRHLKSDVEKDRMLARAETYMAERGFAQTQDGYCALGRYEIAQNSEIGALLRLNE